MYRVIKRFYDLTDNNHLYEVGDSYPRDGLSPSLERVQSLMTDENRQHKPLIKEIKTRKKGKNDQSV